MFFLHFPIQPGAAFSKCWQARGIVPPRREFYDRFQSATRRFRSI